MLLYQDHSWLSGSRSLSITPPLNLVKRAKSSSLRKEIATLQFTCERYASTERIEKIAHEKLNLEYPVSSQIVIIQLEKQSNPKLSDAPKEFLVYLKKTISGDRG